MDEKRIYINARIFLRVVQGRITGVERYASEIIKRLPKEIHLLKPNNAANGFRGHLWEQLKLPTLVNSGSVLWSPANTGPLSIRNQVLTIHDISVIEHPEWYDSRFSTWYRFLLPKLARTARYVITVSEFSRSQIIKQLRLDPNRVTSIPPGIDLTVFKPSSPATISSLYKKYNLNKPYFLFLGTLQPRKNLSHLIRAWNMFSLKAPEFQLVIVGGTHRNFPPNHFQASSKSLQFFNYIPDDDLPALYSGALALVHPSLYEGSGLPLLEAMACGCPLIASDNTALPETTGRAALLIDPTDLDCLVEAFFRLIEDSVLRGNLISKGMERVKLFSWEKTASRIWNILQQTNTSI